MDTNTDRSRRLRCVGGVLGLVLGDALGSGNTSGETLQASVSAQVALFTIEGTIVALQDHERGNEVDLAALETAYHRWATMQSIPADNSYLRGRDGKVGWLSNVALLTQHRGHAPTLVQALHDNPGRSRGYQVVPRTIPLALLGAGHYMQEPELGDMVEKEAGRTHQHPDATAAAREAVRWVVAALNEDVRDVTTLVLDLLEETDPLGLLKEHDRWEDRGDPGTYARITEGRSARDTLAGALYTIISEPDTSGALLMATNKSPGDAVGTMVGMLHGARWGTENLPLELLSRCELVWVGSELGTDLYDQMTRRPGGDQGALAPDPLWDGRYPPN